MGSIYETVLYKRTPEEVVKICKNPKLSKTWSIWVSGKLDTQYLIDSVTRERKYKWDRRTSTLTHKKWYEKYCPKVSHDYTFGQLLDDALHSPGFHISLAIIWISLSSYIHYYKFTQTVSESDENKLAGGLIISSAILHFLLYFVLFTIVRFSYTFNSIHAETILMTVFLLLNPITIPVIILGLNLASVEGREKYKEYLWKINTGFSAVYGVLGLLMGWVSLWFWF